MEKTRRTMSDRDKAAREYAQSIMSDGYAVGRSEAQKLIEGVMVSNAHNAGWDAALARVLEMAREKAREVRTDVLLLSMPPQPQILNVVELSDLERICGGGHEK
jgi:hypothetical protein